MHDCSRQEPAQRQLHMADISIFLFKEMWRCRRSSHLGRLLWSHCCPPPPFEVPINPQPHSSAACEITACNVLLKLWRALTYLDHSSTKHYSFSVLNCTAEGIRFAEFMPDTTMIVQCYINRLSGRYFFTASVFRILPIVLASNTSRQRLNRPLGLLFLFCSEGATKWVRGGTKVLQFKQTAWKGKKDRTLLQTARAYL